MSENIDKICEQENELALDLDAKAAEEQRRAMEAYKQNKNSLAYTYDFILDLACGKNCGFKCSEEERQGLIDYNQNRAKELRESIREYEEVLRLGKKKVVKERVNKIGLEGMITNEIVKKQIEEIFADKRAELTEEIRYLNSHSLDDLNLSQLNDIMRMAQFNKQEINEPIAEYLCITDEYPTDARVLVTGYKWIIGEIKEHIDTKYEPRG